MPPTPRHVFNDIAPSRARPVYIPSQHATDRATRLHIIVEGHTLRTKKEAWKLAAPLLSYGMREVKPVSKCTLGGICDSQGVNN